MNLLSDLTFKGSYKTSTNFLNTALKPALKKDIKMAFSTSKTCEIGLSENSGIDYNSIFYLIDKCTSSKE